MVQSIFEEMGGRYERQGEYILPCLTIPPDCLCSLYYRIHRRTSLSMLLLLCKLYISHNIHNLCLLFSFDFIVLFQLSSVCGYIIGYQFRHYITCALTVHIGNFL